MRRPQARKRATGFGTEVEFQIVGALEVFFEDVTIEVRIVFFVYCKIVEIIVGILRLDYYVRLVEVFLRYHNGNFGISHLVLLLSDLYRDFVDLEEALIISGLVLVVCKCHDNITMNSSL